METWIIPLGHSVNHHHDYHHDYRVPFNAHPTYVGVVGKGGLAFLLSPPGKAMESQVLEIK